MTGERIYYAIGDVHGEARRLAEMHEAIFAEHDRSGGGRAITIVHLGDYVDRGSNSRGVIEQVIRLEARYRDDDRVNVVSLRGNHEQMMLDALREGPGSDESLHWLLNGGDKAIESYAVANGEADVDAAHREWLEALPHIWTAEEGRLIFVHAGIEPREYPDDRTDIHLWTRSPRFFRSEDWTNPELEGCRVVHGHTPTSNEEPEISADGRRINVDTGAVYGGPLTAAVIEGPDRPVRFLRIGN